MKWLLNLLLILITMSAQAQTSELQTVPHVDLKRYLGKWYDIASFPQSFQKGCSCTTAEKQMEALSNSHYCATACYNTI
ncbi:MAG: hypothetical protein EOP49_35860 [Sphingobacteriales bacterium]|nr:MAG: hypothetical protein EOP49_35860 [Sphingobacteriales bacterium]